MRDVNNALANKQTTATQHRHLRFLSLKLALWRHLPAISERLLIVVAWCGSAYDANCTVNFFFETGAARVSAQNVKVTSTHFLFSRVFLSFEWRKDFGHFEKIFFRVLNEKKSTKLNSSTFAHQTTCSCMFQNLKYDVNRIAYTTAQ